MKPVVLALFACASMISVATAQQSLSCPPSASCLLQLARDAAFQRYLAAPNAARGEQAISVITWAGRLDTAAPAAALRQQFTSLRTRIDRIPLPSDREKALTALAQAMAAHDLITEAQSIGKTLSTAHYRDVVRAELAVSQARRGRAREAFAELDRVEGGELTKIMAYSRILNGVISVGRPDYVREASKFMKEPDPELISGMLVLADQAAGNHEAARAGAMRIANREARVATLYQLHKKYFDKGLSIETLATARLLHAEAQQLKIPELTQEGLDLLIDALADQQQYTEVLRLIPQLPDNKRGGELADLSWFLKDAADLRAAEKLAAQMPPEPRIEVQQRLLVRRVVSGELKAATAIRQTDDPAALADGLIQASYELQDAGQRPQAQEAVSAAVAAMPQMQGDVLFWLRVADAQVNVGMVVEARRTIEGQLAQEGLGAEVLLKLSAKQAAQGQKQEAQRTRELAMREFTPERLDFSPDSIAMALYKAGLLDEAEQELRRVIKLEAPRFQLSPTASIVLMELVKRGDLARALDLAAAVSKRLGDDPEPFVHIYMNLTRDPGPGMGPGIEDPSAPIRATIEP